MLSSTHRSDPVNRLLTTALLAFCLLQPAFAADPAPASDASIKELLKITESQKLIDESMKNVDNMMLNSMRRALSGQKLVPDDQKIIDAMRAKMTALLKEEMTWEKFEPRVIDIYRKTFSQEEIDGMTAFYKSKAGQAVVAKMPQVMHNSVQSMQEMMSTVTPKLMQLQKDTVAELKAAKPQK